MINKVLKEYRKNKAKLKFVDNTINLIIFGFSLFIILMIFENIFYFNQINREKIFLFYFGIILILFFYITIKWFINSNGFLNTYSDIKIAKEIGSKNSKINDSIINAIQIQKNKNADRLLVNLFIKKINKLLKSLYSKIFRRNYSYKKPAILFQSGLSPIYRLIFFCEPSANL